MAEKRGGASVQLSVLPGTSGVPSKRHRGAPSSVIENLPLDILKLIFSRFPFRALLRSIALVCKRFRCAALNSVESFCFDRTLKSNRLDLFLSLFPSLTSLEVRRRPEQPVLLPHSLRRLCMELDIHQDSMNIISTVPLPSLVFLLLFFFFNELGNYFCYASTTIDLSVHSESAFPMQLLRASFDSLTSLTLAVRVLYGIVTDGLLESHLASTRFPSLRHLDLTVSEVVRSAQADNMLRFVVLHAPQIEALVLSGCINVGGKPHSAFFESVARLPFPNLRDLELRVSGLRPTTLTTLLSNSTQLTNLKISGMDSFDNVPTPLLSSLVELRTITIPSSMEFLIKLPRLASIWLPVPFPMPLSLSTYLSFRARLSHFEFGGADSTEAVWSALRSDLTNLSHLSLRHRCPDPNIVFNLPHLDKLSIQRSEVLSFADTVTLLLVFLRNVPSLRKLTVCLPKLPLTDAELLQLADVLRRAAVGTLQKVKLFLHSEDARRLIPLLAFGLVHGWLQVVIGAFPNVAAELDSESDSTSSSGQSIAEDCESELVFV